jgi:hypothetical protein
VYSKGFIAGGRKNGIKSHDVSWLSITAKYMPATSTGKTLYPRHFFAITRICDAAFSIFAKAEREIHRRSCRKAG